MVDLLDYDDHVQNLNRRLNAISQKLSSVFHVQLEEDSVSVSLPEKYDAFARQYVTDVEHKTAYVINAMVDQLGRLHIINPTPLVMPRFSWEAIDEKLTDIEETINKY